MKKEIMLSFVMMGAMMLPVHAEDTPQTGETELSYEQASTYTLSIPTNISLSDSADQELEIKLSAANIRPDQKVEVKCSDGIDASSLVTLTRTGGGEIKVKVTTDGTSGVTSSQVLASFVNHETTASTGGKIQFAKIENVDSGSYTGKVTFTAALETN